MSGVDIEGSGSNIVLNISGTTDPGGKHTHGGRWSFCGSDGQVENFGWPTEVGIAGNQDNKGFVWSDRLNHQNMTYLGGNPDINPTDEGSWANPSDTSSSPGTNNDNYPLYPSPEHDHTFNTSTNLNPTTIANRLSLTGSADVVNTSHTHSYTPRDWTTLPPHRHEYSINYQTIGSKLSASTASNHNHEISGNPGIVNTLSINNTLGFSQHEASVVLSSFGSDEAFNATPPWMSTNFIIRSSSIAKAALLDDIDVNLSLEGLNNVTDASPEDNQYIRYSTSSTRYEKIDSVIGGFGKNDNQDLVLDVSTSSSGTTANGAIISQQGQFYIGATGPGTSTYMNDTPFVVRNQDDNDTCYGLFQGNNASGLSGAYYGVDNGTVELWNYGSENYDGWRNFEFWDGVGKYNTSSKRVATISPVTTVIGLDNVGHAGSSLDVEGGVAAEGDIFTYGGTFGVYGRILGVSGAIAAAGYNLPESRGTSGEALLASSGQTLAWGPAGYWSADGNDISYMNGDVLVGTEDAMGVSFGVYGSVKIDGSNLNQSTTNGNYSGAPPNLEVVGGASFGTTVDIGGQLNIGGPNVSDLNTNTAYVIVRSNLAAWSSRQWIINDHEDGSTALEFWSDKGNKILFRNRNGSGNAVIKYTIEHNAVEGGGDGELRLYPYGNDTAFVMDPNGKIGIGTYSPSTFGRYNCGRLAVNGDIAGQTLDVNNVKYYGKSIYRHTAASGDVNSNARVAVIGNSDGEFIQVSNKHAQGIC